MCGLYLVLSVDFDLIIMHVDWPGAFGWQLAHLGLPWSPGADVHVAADGNMAVVAAQWDQKALWYRPVANWAICFMKKINQKLLRPECLRTSALLLWDANLLDSTTQPPWLEVTAILKGISGSSGPRNVWAVVLSGLEVKSYRGRACPSLRGESIYK